MASDAASATATVVRATAAQVRLRLSDDREVTKRVTVPAEIRDALEGATVPVTVTGTGARAKIELADGWLDGIGGAPKAKRTRSGAPKAAAKTTAKDADGKPVRKRTRGTTAAKASEAKADAPAKAEAAPKAKSTRAKSAAKPAAKGTTAKAATAKSTAKADDAKPAAKRTRKPAAAKAKAEAPAAPAAKAEKAAEAPKAAAPKAEAPKADAPRQDAPAAKSSRSRRRRNVPAIPKVDPELIRTQIAGAVDLVRKARKLTRR